MKKMILILDESGEKQYSSKKESEFAAFGVMAGIFVSEDSLDEIRSLCKSFFSCYSINGKLHITDLKEEKQSKLRNDVICLFKYLGIRWFFEAIPSQGFYENYNLSNRLGYATYKNKPQLLHSKLLKGMFLKSACLLMSNDILNAHIEVITDTVDKGILKKFDIEIKTLVEFLKDNPKVGTFHLYNEENNKFEEKKLSVHVQTDFPKFKSLSYDILCEDSEITLLIDVLVNMTYYHIKNYIDEEITSYPTEYNSYEILGNHPLRDLVIVNNEKQFSDIQYRRENF